MPHTLKVCLAFLVVWLGILPKITVVGQTLPDKLNSFLQKEAAGRININTNQLHYLAGDTVFFRVGNWQLNADDLLELQLISPDPKLSQTTKVLLTNGSQVSYLILPKEAVSGDYVVRAYSLSGWEASTLIQVYNLNQKTKEYYSCNWLYPETNPKISLIKQANTWEIFWTQSQAQSNSKGWLLITGPNQVYYSHEIDLSLLQNKISAPLTAFPTSQAQITLATNTGEILSNYTFNSNETQNHPLQLILNKTRYVNREPVEFQISNPNKVSYSGNSQIFVRVLEQIDTLSKKGYLAIKQDNSYSFFNSFPHFNLKKIAGSTSQNNDCLFVLKGQLISALDKKPVANSLIHLLAPATSQTEVLYSDKDGRIRVELDPFAGTKSLLFRAIQEGEEIKNINFLPDSSQQVTSWRPTFTTNSLSPPQQELIKKFKILNRINQAFYAGMSPENNNRSSYLKSAAFQENKLKPTTSYDLSKYEKFSNVTEIFRELVPAVEVIKRKDGMRARLYARLLKKFYNHFPLFLIDGTPTYDVETILNLPANQLAKIDIFNTSIALAPFDVLSTGGVIALYTPNRNFNPTLLHDNLLEYAGTAPAYVPKNLKKSEPNLPDFNSLVYWNPQVKPDAQGNAQLTFLTNDQVGRFVVEVTWLTDKGEEISAVKIFTVEAE